MKLIATSATLMAASMIAASAESTQPCCHVCSDPNNKYYSIDTAHNKCGECCMEDKYYGLYHIFESGLKKATSNTMCADLGYAAYESTVTHGFGPVKMTLDLYNPTPKAGDVKPVAEETTIFAATATAEAQPCCDLCADPNNKYYSIASGLFGDMHCGECCMQDKDYGLYHFFEKNLLKADSASPCKDHGYSVYSKTETHGFGPVKMTLDMYNPDPKVKSVLNAVEAPVAAPADSTSPLLYIIPSFVGGVALAAVAAVVGGRMKGEKKIDVDTHHLLA